MNDIDYSARTNGVFTRRTNNEMRTSLRVSIYSVNGCECSIALIIVVRPIEFDEIRQDLFLAYLSIGEFYHRKYLGKMVISMTINMVEKKEDI
jgi:hypothetical protein